MICTWVCTRKHDGLHKVCIILFGVRGEKVCKVCMVCSNIRETRRVHRFTIPYIINKNNTNYANYPSTYYDFNKHKPIQTNANQHFKAPPHGD